MKALIVFYTQSGMTEKVANAIHAAISKSTEATIKQINEIKPTETIDYDIVFVGSPCHHSDIVEEVKAFLSKIPKQSKFKLAGFVTHACYPKEKGGKYIDVFDRWVGKSEKSFETIATENELNYAGFFSCQAAAVEPIDKFINREIIPDKDEFAEFLVESKKHPNEQDLENAKKFALKVIES